MPDAPSGTVTFLFTDIEGSTRLWEDYPEAMRSALAWHHALLRQTIEDHNGHVFKTVGDAFCAAFSTASDAVHAALEIQMHLNHTGHRGHRGENTQRTDNTQADTEAVEPLAVPPHHILDVPLHSEVLSFPPEGSSASSASSVVQIRVRMALHTGVAEERDSDYFGPPLNRVARLLSLAAGGQTLLSGTAWELACDSLPPAVTLRDLGLHRLRDLARPEQVFELLHPDLPAEFPALKSLSNLPNNLPEQLTSFIGREREIATVKELMRRHRLLTLTGSGGCGKTRLALQIAAECLPDYPEGAWLIDLGSLFDPSLVLPAVASTLGCREQAGKPLSQTLMETLKPQTTLLILDNCEHLLAACRQLADAALRSSAGVKILATSREGLGIAGEQVVRIPSLSLPDPHEPISVASVDRYEAVRLFRDRAVLVKSDFAVTDQSVPAVISTCRRLDGIPLAIELAAARVRALSVEEIDRRLDNRFRLLTGGSRTALPRQQTLRALIDWSYDLLNDQERLLLNRLSIFSGGWTLEEAEQICSAIQNPKSKIQNEEVLDLLTSLVDKSLVIMEEHVHSARYRMLETVRQYAAEKLGASDEVPSLRTRHRDFFLALALDANSKLRGPAQADSLEQLELEHDNLRSALAWCLDSNELEVNREEDSQEEGSGFGLAGVSQPSQFGLRLASVLFQFWDLRGYVSEGRSHLERILKRDGADARTMARAQALQAAGGLALRQGDYAQARSYLEESLAIHRELQDRRGIATALGSLGNVDYHQGDYVRARSRHEQALAIRRETGDRSSIASSLVNLGNVSYQQGDYEGAHSAFDECLTIWRDAGDWSNVAFALNSLGNVATDLGDYSRAETAYEESLKIRRELGEWRHIAGSLNNLANVAYAQGDLDRARALHEESLEMRRKQGNRQGIGTSLTNLGMVAFGQGRLAEAAARFAEALTLQWELGDRRNAAFSLQGLSGVLLALGDADTAVRSTGAAEALRESIGAVLPPSERQSYDEHLAKACAALGNPAFEAARTAGRAMTTEQAIACALAASNSHYSRTGDS